MRTPKTLVPIPPKLAAGIDRIVGHGQRTRFIVELVESELRRREQLAALPEAAGSWNDENHSERSYGADAWVSRMRKESEDRFQRLQDQRESG